MGAKNWVRSSAIKSFDRILCFLSREYRSASWGGAQGQGVSSWKVKGEDAGLNCRLLTSFAHLEGRTQEWESKKNGSALMMGVLGTARVTLAGGGRLT